MSDDGNKLPPPVYPDLAMPDDPETGIPKDVPHVSCDSLELPGASTNMRIDDPIPGVPRVLIGIPILNYSHEFVQNFIKFWTELCSQETGKLQAGYHFVYRRPVHMAEQQIVETAVYNKCTHVLFIDDDIYGYSVSDLRKLLEADKDVIAGIMHASKFPYAMCAFRRFNTDRKVIDMPSDNSMYRLYEIPCRCEKCGYGLSHWDAKFCPVCGATQDNMVQKVDLIPFCFTLMKTSIFAAIKKPWFHCTDKYPSDSWFADRCIEAGIQEYAHMGVRLTHAGVNDTTKPYLFQMGLEERRKDESKGLVVVTPEEMERHQFLLNTKMVEAENRLKLGESPAIITVGEQEEDKNDGSQTDVSNGLPKEEGVTIPG